MNMYYVGTIPCMPTDLRHHGIMGMKWGVRRFQNRDGTYTSAGRSRYGSSGRGGSGGGHNMAISRFSPHKNAVSVLSERMSKQMTKNRNLNGDRKTEALQSARKQDINKMSNKELKDQIERMNLEKQYRQLTKRDVSAGEKWMTDTAKSIVTGTVVGLGTAALTKFIKDDGIPKIGRVLNRTTDILRRK